MFLFANSDCVKDMYMSTRAKQGRADDGVPTRPPYPTHDVQMDHKTARTARFLARATRREMIPKHRTHPGCFSLMAKGAARSSKSTFAWKLGPLMSRTSSQRSRPICFFVATVSPSCCTSTASSRLSPCVALSVSWPCFASVMQSTEYTQLTNKQKV